MSLIVGEALNRRADLQKRVAQLQDRLSNCVLAQEDEEPPESPSELLAELDRHCDELQQLIAQINHTNARARNSQPVRPSQRGSHAATSSLYARARCAPQSKRPQVARASD